MDRGGGSGATSIVVSVVLSIVLWLLSRGRRRGSSGPPRGACQSPTFDEISAVKFCTESSETR
jgi:hypothetical protein